MQLATHLQSEISCKAGPLVKALCWLVLPPAGTATRSRPVGACECACKMHVLLKDSYNGRLLFHQLLQVTCPHMGDAHGDVHQLGPVSGCCGPLVPMHLVES